MSTAVPVVDLGAGDAPARIARAAEQVGFFQVVGHGVPPAVSEAAWEAAWAFFDLPVPERAAVAMPEPGYPYGWSPMAAETLSSSLDVGPDGPAGPAGPAGPRPGDLKESFAIGPVDPPPGPPVDADEAWAFSPNLWPVALPALRPAWEAYYREMSALAARLMSCFAVGLGLDERWFDPLIGRHASAMRAVHYPPLPGPPPPGSWRASPHTDYGTLTILRQDDVGGLEVRTAGGTWVPVPPLPGAFVVNLGDLMQRWTNDRWRSTLHRVVADPWDRRRLSLPFFHNADWDALVEPIDPGAPARHPPVKAGPHLMAKFRSTVVPPAQ